MYKNSIEISTLKYNMKNGKNTSIISKDADNNDYHSKFLEYDKD